jgi:hypothetical protein
MTLDHLDALISFIVIISGVSLIVTTLTQLISSTLGLRGTNLRWGIQTLLAELDPVLAPHAEAISQRVLHHPLVSDSTLSTLRTRLAGRWRLASAIREDELIDILHRLVGDDATVAAGEPWQAALKTAFDRLDRNAAEQVLLAARGVQPGAATAGASARGAADLLAQSEMLSRGVRDWFSPMMDRVSQRFAYQMRMWTVVFSFVIAFALHFDSLTILSDLSSNPDVRTRLVASADTLSKRADALSAATPNTTPPEGDVAAVRSAADSLGTLLNERFALHLIPDPYPQPFYAYWKPSWLHLVGVLASAVLLSLGAPFWFNTLKTLLNLRPVLATRVAKEEVAPARS